jgi:DNA repair exonuclease SbcCD nuclease subunit
VGGNTEHESYAPCSVDDLTGTHVDYWALGHVHTRQVTKEHSPTIVYPGNPQGRNPKEGGPRGVYLVEVSESGAVKLEFRPMDCVRWDHVEVSIDTLEDEQALLDRVDKHIDQLLNRAEGRHLVYRLKVHGRGPLHKAIRRTEFLDDLQESINESWSREQPFAWCERIQTETSPPIDREQRKKAGDFVGDLLRYVDEAKTDGGRIVKLREELEALYTHNRAKRYLSPSEPTEEELRLLIAEAESRCLDHLAAEEEL